MEIHATFLQFPRLCRNL